jgi:hypothetical protein
LEIVSTDQVPQLPDLIRLGRPSHFLEVERCSYVGMNENVVAASLANLFESEISRQFDQIVEPNVLKVPLSDPLKETARPHQFNVQELPIGF